MRGLVVYLSGESEIIEELHDDDVYGLLGAGVDEIESEDGSCGILVHELSNVAELGVNPHASLEAGVVIGGPVIIVPADEDVTDGRWFTDEYRVLVRKRNRDEDLRRRLVEYEKSKLEHRRFVHHEPDRWIYSGEAFKAIVLAGSNDKAGDDESFSLWLFGDDPENPFTMRIVEYSFCEVMEMMIEGDLQAARGQAPDHLLPALKKLGMI